MISLNLATGQIVSEMLMVSQNRAYREGYRSGSSIARLHFAGGKPLGVHLAIPDQYAQVTDPAPRGILVQGFVKTLAKPIKQLHLS
jgi:hypothetical protein